MTTPNPQDFLNNPNYRRTTLEFSAGQSRSLPRSDTGSRILYVEDGTISVNDTLLTTIVHKEHAATVERGATVTIEASGGPARVLLLEPTPPKPVPPEVLTVLSHA